MTPKYLYHGSPIQGLKVLEPRKISVRSDQKEPRVYAVCTKTEAAIFAYPFHDRNSHISWHGEPTKIYLNIFNKKLIRKYPASIYLIKTNSFKSVDESNIEWYSTKPVEIMKEIRIKDALKYAKRNGAVITTTIA